MRHYIGVVHKDADSDYGVSFPDFPGAVTAARTIEEVVEMAQEALALHVEGMLAEGEAIPEPSSFDQVQAEPEFSDGLPVLVPLKTDALAMRVNVTLPASVLRRIDEYVEQQGMTRSGFLAAAAQHELGFGREYHPFLGAVSRATSEDESKKKLRPARGWVRRKKAKRTHRKRRKAQAARG
jgi:predicted RNase H-like HicB family nuclease